MSGRAIVDWNSLPSRRQLVSRIEQLDISADAKVALTELAGIASRTGDKIIEIGRRIVAFCMELMRQFPNLSFTVLAALAINVVIGTVPLLGPLLNPFLAPLLLAAGIGLGALAELRDGDLASRMDWLTREVEAMFA